MVAAGLVFGLWYPSPFREISGGRELFFIVVAVDVVLGPLITFAVFDRRKATKELVRDLSVVALLQLGGLAYGLHTVFEARPVVLALEHDRLRVVRAIDLDEADLAKAPVGLRRLPLWGVRLVATRQVLATEKLEAIDRGLQGQDVGMRPEFWLPEAEAAGALAAAAEPVAALQQRYRQRANEMHRWIDRTGRTQEQLGFLPILARTTDWVALIDKQNGQVVGYAPFDGF